MDYSKFKATKILHTEQYNLDKLTFLIIWHFAVSVYPTISSGVHNLTKGNSDLRANVAAMAVLPELGGPKIIINLNII